MGYIIGVDEVGRGPLAGPVVAGAVVLTTEISGLADSKRLTARARQRLGSEIRERCRWAVGEASVAEIDEINILNATLLAMTRAVAALVAQIGAEPAMVLIDGNRTPEGRIADWRWEARAIIGGDGSEPAISAASIIAKVHRDAAMAELAAAHPGYGWESNAG